MLKYLGKYVEKQPLFVNIWGFYSHFKMCVYFMPSNNFYCIQKYE